MRLSGASAAEQGEDYADQRPAENSVAKGVYEGLNYTHE